MTFRPILAAASLFMLAACGSDDPASEEQIEQGGEAAGEVLGGTISDDMLPLGELTSTSPPAQRSASDDNGGSSATSSTDDEPESEEAETASSAAPASQSAPAPASTPTVAPPLED